MCIFEYVFIPDERQSVYCVTISCINSQQSHKYILFMQHPLSSFLMAPTVPCVDTEDTLASFDSSYVAKSGMLEKAPCSAHHSQGGRLFFLWIIGLSLCTCARVQMTNIDIETRAYVTSTVIHNSEQFKEY